MLEPSDCLITLALMKQSSSTIIVLSVRIHTVPPLDLASAPMARTVMTTNLIKKLGTAPDATA